MRYAGETIRPGNGTFSSGDRVSDRVISVPIEMVQQPHHRPGCSSSSSSSGATFASFNASGTVLRLLTVLAYVGTVTFLSLSAFDVGVLPLWRREDWIGPVEAGVASDPQWWLLVVSACALAMLGGWVVRFATMYTYRDATHRATVAFWGICVFLCLWNASSLI